MAAVRSSLAFRGGQATVRAQVIFGVFFRSATGRHFLFRSLCSDHTQDLLFLRTPIYLLDRSDSQLRCLLLAQQRQALHVPVLLELYFLWGSFHFRLHCAQRERVNCRQPKYRFPAGLNQRVPRALTSCLSCGILTFWLSGEVGCVGKAEAARVQHRGYHLRGIVIVIPARSPLRAIEQDLRIFVFEFGL